MGHQKINIQTYEFGCQVGEPIELSVSPAELDYKVLAFLVAKLAQPRAQCLYPRHVTGRILGTQQSHAPDFALLLSERAEWGRKRTRAKRDDKFAAIVHCLPR
jgi:hypothetical protein